MRIGIPQGLLYFKNGRLWKRNLNALGIEVVTSPETTEGILSDGIRHSVCDLCLPVKAFFGHVLALKDNVDCLFIPRVIRVEPDAFLCPKFIGLPDMVRAAIRNLPRIIDTEFNIKEKPEAVFWQEVRRELKGDRKMLLRGEAEAISTNEILRCAQNDRKRRNDKIEKDHRLQKFSEHKLTVGIAGRPYLVLDNYLNKGVVRYMNRLGVSVVYQTPEKNYIIETMSMLPKWIYWSMGKEVVSSVRRMLEDESIDGIILIANAGCGPDSFMTELIDGTLPVHKKPYMSLSIDEHLSDAGLQTRIEAFVDMIERKFKYN
ncbi:MAG: hypothetical protein FJ241_09775 [Nitrospira sp.]|nr:hypothetical protein [Nitrospira sp.]